MPYCWNIRCITQRPVEALLTHAGADSLGTSSGDNYDPARMDHGRRGKKQIGCGLSGLVVEIPYSVFMVIQ